MRVLAPRTNPNAACLLVIIIAVSTIMGTRLGTAAVHLAIVMDEAVPAGTTMTQRATLTITHMTFLREDLLGTNSKLWK